MNMSRKTLAWANKEVETFLCILGAEDVVYDVYVAAAAIDIRPTLKGTVGGGNATSELSWAPFPDNDGSSLVRSFSRWILRSIDHFFGAFPETPLNVNAHSLHSRRRRIVTVY